MFRLSKKTMQTECIKNASKATNNKTTLNIFPTNWFIDGGRLAQVKFMISITDADRSLYCY